MRRAERKFFRFLLVFYPFAIFLTAFFTAASPFGLAQKDLPINFAESNEILVKLRGAEKTYKVSAFAQMSGAELLRLYAANPWVEYAEPNARYGLAAIPNDPEYSRLWYLPQINAPAAWDLGTGSEDVIIAVLDTGVDLDHPDLAPNLWINTLEVPSNGIDDDRNGYIDDVRGWNFVEDTNNPEPALSLGATMLGIHHGTVVTGIIGAVGGNGIDGVGVSWRARIMPLRVLDSRGTGNAATVTEAIDYAIKNGAKILNLSFVGNERSVTLDRAIERAHNAGVLVVVAAGNFSLNGLNGMDLDTSPVYPACSDGPGGENYVVAVAALDTLDQKLAFSNYGRCVDIAAPGVGILNTLFNDPASSDYAGTFGGPWRGTSMAAPQVSGVAALLRARDLSFSNVEIRDILLSKAVSIDPVNPLYQGKLGRGKLDAGTAMQAASAGRTPAGARALVPSSEPRFVVASLGGPEVRVIGRDGTLEKTFMAYAPAFKGGLSAAVGDLDGDGLEEIVTGAGAGGGPHVRIFTAEGKATGNFFAFEPSYRGGIRVETLDINSDGVKEIAVGSGRGREGEVRIFSRDGSLLSRFFVHSRKFKGGFSLAAGDIDRDGKDEIIVAAGPGGGPHVQIYQSDGKLISEFFAFGKDFRGGVEVASGDTDGDGRAEIIAAPAGGGAPNVKIFNGAGKPMIEFLAYGGAPLQVKPGLTLSAFDFDNDGKDEIIVGSGPEGDSVIRVFTPGGLLFLQTDAFAKNARGGFGVGVLQR